MTVKAHVEDLILPAFVELVVDEEEVVVVVEVVKVVRVVKVLVIV